MLTDPPPIMNQTPQNTELFQDHVEFPQVLMFSISLGINGPDGKQEGVKGQIIQTLAKGETMTFGDGCAAIKRPSNQFNQESVNGRSIDQAQHRQIFRSTKVPTLQDQFHRSR